MEEYHNDSLDLMAIESNESKKSNENDLAASAAKPKKSKKADIAVTISSASVEASNDDIAATMPSESNENDLTAAAAKPKKSKKADIAITISSESVEASNDDIAATLPSESNVNDLTAAAAKPKKSKKADIAITISSESVVASNDDIAAIAQKTKESNENSLLSSKLMEALPNELVRALAKMGYKEFTEIQNKAIPVALSGRDILGSAQTGTGKTAAFALPIAASLIRNPESAALIITPTRELAQQVYKIFMQILEFTSIRSSLLIGGDSIDLQIRQLKFGPRVVVGTPGRINDHLDRKTVSFSKTEFLVLDETDRMLDMGFGIQIDNILPELAPKRQTLLFSATISSSIEKLAGKYLTDPERIAVGEKNSVVANIEQQVVHLRESEKFDRLLIELDNRQGSIIVFVRTKHSADRISEKLKNLDHNSCSIHGDLRQNKRERVMHRFRTKKHRILVATDVAARGIDIPHIEHVINYDLTQAPEDFIHRLGRTARAGAKGHAVSFVSDIEHSQWRDIQRLLDPSNSSKDYSDRKGSSRGASRDRRAPSGGSQRPRSAGGFSGNSSARPQRDRAFSGEPRREGSSNFPPRDRSSFSGEPRREGRRDGNSSFPPRDRSSFSSEPRREGRRDGNSSFPPKDRSSFSGEPRREGRRDGNPSFPPRDRSSFSGEPRREGRRDGNSTFAPRSDRPKDRDSNPAFDTPRSTTPARKRSGASGSFMKPSGKNYFRNRDNH